MIFSSMIMAISFSEAAPNQENIAEKAIFPFTECTIAKPLPRQSLEQGIYHNLAPHHTLPESCKAGEDSADNWMMLMLMAGGIVIGVPAVRRRHRRIVFS